MKDLNHFLYLLKSGSAKAQQQLFLEYKGRLLALCCRYTNDRDEAQDILQEVFIKIFSKIDQLQSADRMDSWLRQITVRTAINFYHQQKKRHESVIKIDAIDSPNDDYECLLSNLNDSDLLNLINQLPLKCKIVFNLYAIEGYDHKEIANLMSISPEASRSLFHYGKNILKSKLKSLGIVSYEKYA